MGGGSSNPGAERCLCAGPTDPWQSLHWLFDIKNAGIHQLGDAFKVGSFRGWFLLMGPGCPISMLCTPIGLLLQQRLWHLKHDTFDRSGKAYSSDTWSMLWACLNCKSNGAANGPLLLGGILEMRTASYTKLSGSSIRDGWLARVPLSTERIGRLGDEHPIWHLC